VETDLARRSRAIAAVGHALERLRHTTSIDDLIDRIPREAVALGFNRALFSWVQESRWIARAACSSRGPTEAQAMVAAGSTPPYRHMRDLLEADLIRGRTPILVDDISRQDRRIHRELLSVTGSTSYVAAPLIAGNIVIGLLHADENAITGRVDAFDRDILGLFCAGLSLAYERTVLAQRLDRVRETVRGQLTALADTVDDQLVGELSPPEQPGVDPPTLLIGFTLTPREAEVLQLLASGLTNSQIGNRLYVAEGTVKTHVKSLLRKLGAANRAEAVSLFHRHEHPRNALERERRSLPLG
jgi:DNA-binding CsgD family transcriptional regulator